MPAFTAKDVQALRQATGAGMLDAKRALEESDGNMEEASQWLRVKGLAGAAKRSDREASQGAASLAVEGQGAAIVELRCETDFVAKAPEFVELVDELARVVAAKGEEAAQERSSSVDDLRTTLKENISVGRVVRFENVPETLVGSYLHVQAGRGINAVIVELQGGTEALAHDIAVHIAFSKPPYLSREDIPADSVAAERAMVEEISRNEGKPEAALPKIIDGRMNGWFKDRCLLEQSYVRDEKRSIADLLGDARITRFAQVVVGG